jgi:hypothetical protein
VYRFGSVIIRRLRDAGLFLLVGCAAVSLLGGFSQVSGFAGRAAAVSSGRARVLVAGRTAAGPKPVRAVSPPASVAVALQKTQLAHYLVLIETSQSGPSRYEIDNRRGRAESWTGRTVSLIQIGRKVYAPKPGSSCYALAVRSSALLPNVAGTLLPSGVAGLRYKIKGRTIQWSTRTTGAYQPHGRVRVNAAGRIVAATVYSGPGVPLTASVSYPAEKPKIAAPTKLCVKSKTRSRTVDR